MANTAYEKAKEETCKKVKEKFQKKAYKNFLKHLNLAIENLYLCDMDNNAAVLSYDIKTLYSEMKDFNPFEKT